MTLVLTWRVPDRPMLAGWIGPQAAADLLARAPIAAIIGPPGPAGPAGESRVYEVANEAGTWIIPHDLGRLPQVQVYLATGELVLADVAATTTTITITFASPTAGFVVAS